MCQNKVRGGQRPVKPPSFYIYRPQVLTSTTTQSLGSSLCWCPAPIYPLLPQSTVSQLRHWHQCISVMLYCYQWNATQNFFSFKYLNRTKENCQEWLTPEVSCVIPQPQSDHATEDNEQIPYILVFGIVFPDQEYLLSYWLVSWYEYHHETRQHGSGVCKREQWGPGRKQYLLSNMVESSVVYGPQSFP